METPFACENPELPPTLNVTRFHIHGCRPCWLVAETARRTLHKDWGQIADLLADPPGDFADEPVVVLVGVNLILDATA